MWTIGTILKWTGQYFRERGVDNPRLDAEVLLSHILGKDRLYLYVNFDQPLEQEELTAFRAAVKRRALRWPVAYITGRREFMGLDFAVTPAVLIPRPETEILVTAALARLTGRDRPAVLDLGTGSGAIIISLLAGMPAARGTAVDISGPALAVARTNAARHGVSDRIVFRGGDLFAPLDRGQLFDAILANPPYIPAADIAGLEPEVRCEPAAALNGGADGLAFYRRILAGAGSRLKADGFIALEVGAGQAPAVSKLAGGQRLQTGEIVKDYAGIERVVILTIKEV